MTVILLALALSESALTAAETRDQRLVVDPQTGSSADRRRWTPGADSWKREGDQECPAFFKREVKGLGVFRIGPRCTEEEIPYAL